MSLMVMNLNEIKELIKKGEIESSVILLNQFIQENPACSDEPFYLLGNAYRKQGNWQLALNNYLDAIERNPESPAINAKKMLMDILEFYNKDMYNQ